jgi:hypothetical protein
MALRATSLAPYSLQLRSMQLTHLSSGWSLLHNSGQDLAAERHIMHYDDVYMAALSLSAALLTPAPCPWAPCNSP